MRLLRLFAAIFSLSLKRELAFRANLLFQILITVIGIVAGFATLQIIYTQTDALGGWRLGEAVVLLGTFQIVSGFLSTFVEPNIAWFAGQVKDGRLDNILLQPVPGIFMASLGTCAPLALSQIIVGCIVVVVGLRMQAVLPSWWNLFAWLILLTGGIVITWASRVLLASLAFWAPIELDVLYGAIWQFGRYPVSIYRQPLRFLLSYVLPIAFISTLPASALTRGISPLLLLTGVAVGIVASIITLLVWRIGLRRYTSATS